MEGVTPPQPSGRGKPGAGQPVTLAGLTTLGVGGPVANYTEVESESDLIEAVVNADREGTPLLVIGEGSNIVAGDGEFDGTVVRDVRTGFTGGSQGACAGAIITVPAGAPWDETVVHCVENSWMGPEVLSGIPGSTGATAVQNVGAYGGEVSEIISGVRAWDRLKGRPVELSLSQLGFAYRDSLLKRTYRSPEAGGGRTWGPTGRYVVLEVSLHMRLASLSAPVRYAQLAQLLGVELGKRAPSKDVRDAVLELRRGKAMVLCDEDRDTWSAGSFFINPVIDAQTARDRLPADAPRYAVGTAGQVKTSAAWLLQHAGFGPGYPGTGPVGTSTKHSLAITNRGGAKASDVVALARELRAGVEAKYGITLVPEPVCVGVEI